MCNILKHVEPAVHLFSVVQFASKRESGEQRASFSTRISKTFSDTDTTFSSAIDVWVRDPPTVSILPAAAYVGLLDNACCDQPILLYLLSVLLHI